MYFISECVVLFLPFFLSLYFLPIPEHIGMCVRPVSASVFEPCTLFSFGRCRIIYLHSHCYRCCRRHFCFSSLSFSFCSVRFQVALDCVSTVAYFTFLFLIEDTQKFRLKIVKDFQKLPDRMFPLFLQYCAHLLKPRKNIYFFTLCRRPMGLYECVRYSSYILRKEYVSNACFDWYIIYIFQSVKICWICFWQVRAAVGDENDRLILGHTSIS